MNVQSELFRLLPQGFREWTKNVPPRVWESAQELRLRCGCPPFLVMPTGRWTADGTVCTEGQLERLVSHLCGYSVHTHQTELSRGFIGAANGWRVGVAGTAADGTAATPRTVRQITSLCIRLSRPHPHCAAALLPYVCRQGALCGLLIGGEPSGGKTSLLRDLAVALGEGRGLSRPYAVTVLDERGEIGESAAFDRLRGYRKAVGMEQAVRTLAPEAILLDELGDKDDLEAVRYAAGCGVAVIATIHIRTQAGPTRALCRQAVESGAFAHVALLTGRSAPGQVAGVYTAAEFLR